MATNWSNYQKNIFDFFKNNTESAVISAGAGSGKTTTMAECAKIASRMGQTTLFCAFNKSIAKEIADKMTRERVRNVFCKTLHAHGFSAIRRAYKDVQIDNQKWKNYVINHLNELTTTTFEKQGEMYGYIATICNLLNLCRINLVQSGDEETIEQIAYHHGIDTQIDEESVVSKLLAWAYTYENGITDGTCDYTDMITMPTTDKRIKRYLERYDNVFVDECQDLNKAQQALVLASKTANGRFIAVGDRNQAINGFCGADAEGFDHLVEIAHNEYPLSVCYRCGKEIVRLAQTIVPSIDYCETAIEGEVKHATDLKAVAMGDMIICRKSAPLIALCLKFIANGMSAKVKGVDIAEGMKKLITKMKATDIYDLWGKLDDEQEKMVKALEKKGFERPENAPSIQAFKDKVECIKVVAETCSSLAEIGAKLDAIFTDYVSGRYINLSTIHKAKGLEADRVFIIVPNKLPLLWKGQQKWEYEQELNLQYVAYTRAKKELVIVDLDEDQLAQYDFNEPTDYEDED